MMSAPAPDVHIQRALEAKLVAHLFRDRRLVLVGHLTFLALLTVILWPYTPKAALAVWVGAVIGTGMLRAIWPRRDDVASSEAAGTLRRIRLTVLLNGLAWGVGAALVIARLHLAESIAVLIVLFALIIGSLGTLAADPQAFYRLLGSVAGPLPLGVLAGGVDGLHVAVAASAVTLAGIPIVRYRHGHRALVDLLRATVLGKENERTLLRELQAALAEVKTLRGFLRICASCKRVATEDGRWEQFESYVRSHSEVEFSHGICPDCARKWASDVG